MFKKKLTASSTLGEMDLKQPFKFYLKFDRGLVASLRNCVRFEKRKLTEGLIDFD